MKVRPYIFGDERFVDARADFAEAFKAEGSRLPFGPKWTLVDGVKIVGVGGLESFDGERTLYAWAYMSELSPRGWLRAVRQAEAVILNHAGGRRVEAMPAHTPGARRLLQRIGFRDKQNASS